MQLVISCISHMRRLLCLCVCMCVCLSVCVYTCTMTDCLYMDCRLPSLRQMLPELVGLAKQLGKLHESGLVHQAVHHHFVLVGQQGDWKLARLEEAASMNSSLDESL
jgi:hypothetical protein